MATVLKYRHKTAPGKTFGDVDFTGHVERDFGDHKREVSFSLVYYPYPGECNLSVNNIQIAEFANIELIDCKQGRYDVVIEDNDYLLFHLIPEE